MPSAMAPAQQQAQAQAQAQAIAVQAAAQAIAAANVAGIGAAGMMPSVMAQSAQQQQAAAQAIAAANAAWNPAATLWSLGQQVGLMGPTGQTQQPGVNPFFPQGHPSQASSLNNVSQPVVGIAETAQSFIVSAEIPGVTEKDVEIFGHGQVLTIRGQKQPSAAEKQADFQSSERLFGSFARSITLPNVVDLSKISARISHGLLQIEVPKTAQGKETFKKVKVSTN